MLQRSDTDESIVREVLPWRRPRRVYFARQSEQRLNANVALGCKLAAAMAIAAISYFQISALSAPYHFPSVVLLSLLGSLAILDAKTFILPNVLTGVLAAAGLATTIVVCPDDLWHRLIGGTAIAAAVLALSELHFSLRGRPAVGMGDVKLLAAAGMWMSLTELGEAMMLAAVGSALFALYKVSLSNGPVPRILPLGTFLCMGIWLTWIYGSSALGP